MEYKVQAVKLLLEIGTTTAARELDIPAPPCIYGCGAPYSVIYTHGGTSETYYYVLNQQGDVIRIVNGSGATVAEYTYNGWGEILSVNNKIGTFGTLNPIRYRGYYYDAETGFYYLQSRYYDPSICRFISADYAEYTDLSECNTRCSNLFAYCDNNPVSYCDPEGDLDYALTIVAGAALGAVTNIVSSVITGQEIEPENVLGAAIAGGTSVAKNHIGVRIAGAVISGVIAGVSSIARGGSVGETLLKAGMASTSALLTPGNMAAGLNLIDMAADTLLPDAVFSAGYSLCSAGISAGIGASKKSAASSSGTVSSYSHAEKHASPRNRNRRALKTVKKCAKKIKKFALQISRKMKKSVKTLSILKRRLKKFRLFRRRTKKS